jgi:hypothetical protein
MVMEELRNGAGWQSNWEISHKRKTPATLQQEGRKCGRQCNCTQVVGTGKGLSSRRGAKERQDMAGDIS